MTQPYLQVEFSLFITLGLEMSDTQKLRALNTSPPRNQVEFTVNWRPFQLDASSPKVRPESGPLRAVHLSRQKWPGGLVN